MYVFYFYNSATPLDFVGIFAGVNRYVRNVGGMLLGGQ